MHYENTCQNHKKKLLRQLFWDRQIDIEGVYQQLVGDHTTTAVVDPHLLYRRLLQTYDWYTLLKLIPSEKWQAVLDPDILNQLYPKDLKERYTYARFVFEEIFLKFGEFESAPLFYKIDPWQNILSNKLRALSRLEAKDVVDLCFLCQHYPFSWETMIQQAKEKDLWVEALQVCQLLKTFPTEQLEEIKWIASVPPETFQKDLNTIHNDIFWGKSNSLCKLNPASQNEVSGKRHQEL